MGQGNTAPCTHRHMFARSDLSNVCIIIIIIVFAYSCFPRKQYLFLLTVQNPHCFPCTLRDTPGAVSSHKGFCFHVQHSLDKNPGSLPSSLIPRLCPILLQYFLINDVKLCRLSEGRGPLLVQLSPTQRTFLIGSPGAVPGRVQGTNCGGTLEKKQSSHRPCLKPTQ